MAKYLSDSKKKSGKPYCKRENHLGINDVGVIVLLLYFLSVGKGCAYSFAKP